MGNFGDVDQENTIDSEKRMITKATNRMKPRKYEMTQPKNSYVILNFF